MSTTDIAVLVGITAAIIAVQWGRHTLTIRRFLVPILAMGLVGYHYLNGIPTAGGDLDMIAVCGLVGIAFGLLIAWSITVERDTTTGRIVMEAGLAYAAIWIIVTGSRLAFAWAATNSWHQQVVQFSVQHEITGQAVWTAAFITMAAAMVITRTVVVATRAALLRREPRKLQLDAA